ncbi:MAG: ribosome small subunit-dependent GTPase A [Pseudomonadota bacterium]|nr:ribosome small subunit-dependent GTPase A [Pseudomonadota bacterium]
MAPVQNSGATNRARVVVNFGAELLIETTQGELIRAKPRRGATLPVCGDWVSYQMADTQTARIDSIEPRASALYRPQGRHRKRVMAANVNQLLVVIAPEPAPDAFLIDRYLVAAEVEGISARLVLNKWDLVTSEQAPYYESLLNEYESLGYAVHRVSVPREIGLQRLKEAIDEHLSILVGQSGVGKSSLTRILIASSEVKVGALSEATGTGQHTTTATTLYHVPSGGDILDSPGVRDFKLWTMPISDIAQGFIEFCSQRPCRFHNCTHRDEPECGIRDAAQSGDISPRRYESYLRLVRELT